MACIQPDGTLSGAALAILRMVEEATPTETLARQLGKPLYAVRASLRELSEAGLVTESAGTFVSTPTGRER